MPAQPAKNAQKSDGDAMLILSNGLTNSADEGFLNVATNLVRRLKKEESDCVVVSYEREADFADCHLRLNKLLLDSKLAALLRKNKSQFIYIPFPAPMLSTALRVFILSLLSASRVNALLVMKGDMNFLSRLFMKLSRANIIVLSNDSEEFYSGFLKKDRVKLIKAGVDCEKFIPVSRDRAEELKKKYGFDENKPVILHVGHLNEGRNIRQLMNINPDYQVLLVTSTTTKNEQDKKLKKELLERDNIRIFDDYIESINEIYQLSDVYFFPVVENGHCIDLPLSCLESAACGTPVVTTSYGAMKEFTDKDGFFFIDSFEKINSFIDVALKSEQGKARESVIGYDWNNAVSSLLDIN